MSEPFTVPYKPEEETVSSAPNPASEVSSPGLAGAGSINCDGATLPPPIPPVTAESQALPDPSGMRYQPLRLHAEGGLGQVFLAQDRELHRQVALKRMKSAAAQDADMRRRFLLEAEVTARLEHPGIVPVYGLEVDANGEPCYAMRFIVGESLKEASQRYHSAVGRSQGFSDRRLALRQLLGRFVAVCNTLAYAHSKGIIHRDIKPANIMLGQYGETLVVDWGLTKPTRQGQVAENGEERHLQPSSAGDSTPTVMGQAVGTPAYMSPEQAAGQLDQLGPLSDIYGLGATLYYVLTGQAPFAGSKLRELLKLVQTGEYPRARQVNKDVPAPLEAICQRAMALRPEDRYQSAVDLAADVEHWLADEPVQAYPDPISEQLRRLEGRVRNHLADIRFWQREGFINRRERDRLHQAYQSILEWDSPWLSPFRTLLTGPLLIRVGSWCLVLSSLLWPVLYWGRLTTWARVVSTGIPTIFMAVLGLGYLIGHQRRYALACFGSFALLLLTFELTLMAEFGWLSFPQRAEWECLASWENPAESRPFPLTNTQLFFAALTASFCAAFLLFTLRVKMFAAWLASSCLAVLCAGLLLAGAKERLLHEQISWVALLCLGFAPVLYLFGAILERRLNPGLAKPFYVTAAITFVAATWTLATAGTREWFGVRGAPLKDFDFKIWSLWLMAYSPMFLLWAWETEYRGTEGQRVLTRWLYMLVPISIAIPAQILFGKGMELFSIGSHSLHAFDAVSLLASLALLALGRFMHQEIYVVGALWSLGTWVFRMAFSYFDEQVDWPIAIGLTGAVLVGLGIWQSRKKDAAPEILESNLHL
jgi:serine/threonine protein kinase